MKQNLSFEELCVIVAPIAKKRGVDKIYLFGSRVRGDNDRKATTISTSNPGV